MNSTARIPLARLLRGSRAQIVSVEGEGPFRRRLLELGFVPGTVVTRTGQAPLGDPLSFRVRHAVVSLRRRDAASILVEPVR